MSQTKYATNPDLVVLQSRLFNPAYAGPGKWVIFEPKSRRAFLAVGKDVLPGVIPLLVDASKGQVDIDTMAKACPEIQARELEGLVETGLLREAEEDGVSHNPNFVWRYHVANFDYPFRDYRDPHWREEDAALMEEYARVTPPPPKVARRDGQLYPLPPVDPTDLSPRECPGTDGCLSLRTLGAILRYVFGPIGTYEAPFGPWLHKTSPSGGMRHPTEGVVLLSRGYEGIRPGAYAYDVERHGLAAVDEEYPNTVPFKSSGAAVGFLIRSRVERAMWRYRDPRAFRPVLMDAGHVIETLRLLLGLQGLGTALVEPITSHSASFDWLSEPEIALLVAGDTGTLLQLTPQAEGFPELVACSDGGRYLTNPSLYLDFMDGELMAHSSWPMVKSVVIDPAAFSALTHCLPSRRGDRDTTFAGIVEAIPGICCETVDELIRSHLLLPYGIGKNFYSAAALWCRYGWYLSLLAHLEVRAAGRSSPPAELARRLGRPAELEQAELVPALMKRTTVRTFARDPIDASALSGILADAADACDSPEIGVRLFVAALRVEGLPSGLYEWHMGTKEFVPLGRKLTRREIVALTIGQGWAAGGAASIWAIRRVDLAAPERYETDILELGRVGQRICISATAMELGVFMTPAVTDRDLFDALHVANPLEHVAYYFTVGHPRS